MIISFTANSPKVTEQGFRNSFRIVGCDDVQGKVAGEPSASRWSGKKIAFLHDDGEA